MNSLIASCHYLGHVLQTPPDTRFLGQTRALQQEYALTELAEILTALQGNEENLDQLTQRLAADHLRLFSGPDPLAPPWESVWTEKDRLLFGSCTAAVAQIYAAWGLEINDEGHAPQDHLGLELSFLAHLLQCMEEGITSQNGKTAKDEAKDFLQLHILSFAPQVLSLAQKEAETDFYKAVCAASLRLLAKIGESLSE